MTTWSRAGFPAAALLSLVAAAPAPAAVLAEGGMRSAVFSGTFAQDDDVGLHAFQIGGARALPVILETFSYAAGTLRSGASVPGGGFDPVVSLFDGVGRFVAIGEDGGQRRDATGNAYDDFLSMTLAPGAYQVAVTQYDNFPRASIGGFLMDGFRQEGTGNFTSRICWDEEASFCDAGGNLRTPDYLLEISIVPLPAPLALLLTALAALAGLHRRAKGRAAASPV